MTREGGTQRYIGMRLGLIVGAAGVLPLLIAPAAVAGPVHAHLTGYLRAGPGENYAVLDEISADALIDVQSCQGNWCKVMSGGAPGYVKIDMVNAPQPPSTPPSETKPQDCFNAPIYGHGPHGAEAEHFCVK